MSKHVNRIDELKQQIVDLKKRWPAHTVSPALITQLDELEDALQSELTRGEEFGKDTEAGAKTFVIHAIGYVENEFDQPVALDKIAAVESRLIMDRSLIEGLQGLEVGQQIMVIFYFHLSEGFALLQHPRGDQSRAMRGVFTLRSPHRPNPIGVTVVDLVGIEDNVLRVRGLDACNGTPVLDLKLA